MAATHHQVHMLAQAARMQQVLSLEPDHVHKAAYAEKLEEYKAEWQTFAPADRDEVEAILSDPISPNFRDIRPGMVAAGRAALEG